MHTTTLYCHTQMILRYFQLKGNVHAVNAYFRGYVLHVCSCDSRTVIHIQPRMRGIPRPHTFQATNTVSKDNNAKYFSNSTITQTDPKQCQHFEKKKKKTIFSHVLWVCACMPRDLFNSLGSPGLTWPVSKHNKKVKIIVKKNSEKSQDEMSRLV